LPPLLVDVGAAPSMKAAVSAAVAAALLSWHPATAVAVATKTHTGASAPKLTPALAKDATALAAAEAKQAWTWETQVKAATEANMKYIPLAQAQVDMAKTAAQTAAEQDKAVTVYLQEVRAQADNGAIQAAMSFMSRVKAALESEKALAASNTASNTREAEVRAAKAAVDAAKPYHAMLLRGQKVVYDYFKRAQELASASNHLRAEGMRLAGSAEAYQQNRQPAEANEIILTAHNMMVQAQTMKNEALRLEESAQEINNVLPLWQQAEQAAVAYGAEEANPRKSSIPVQPLT